MARIARACMQSVLKIVNLIVGVAGIAMILYSFWMARVWQRDTEGSSFVDFNSTAPWFIYTFLGIGIILCVITCLGHIAADSANGFCLFCYMVIISVLLLLETAMAVDILLNSDWEKDFPEDPTGRFPDFRRFVESNFDVCKWIGLMIILAQGFSILLAMGLRAVGPNRCGRYDSDDDFLPSRLPLVDPPPPAYLVNADPPLASKTADAWDANR
ncbi:tetraspanin-19-like [Carica papaya]|uniref:tetraspanin-19-like n=1 Tax=Carica papaya TaxID=3649 RepID=UPI000B8CB9BA|nr:tetraspanin-19-like [Carica papaya]